MTWATYVRSVYESRLDDLQLARFVAINSFQSKSLPAVEDLTAGAIYTTLGALLLVNLGLFTLTARGRKLVLEVAESILAVILIILLLGVVLSLPMLALYLLLLLVSWVAIPPLLFAWRLLQTVLVVIKTSLYSVFSSFNWPSKVA